ncbi:MAG: hypothetical protein ACTHQE_16690 [Thermomicrobiales bacterium]
MHRVPVIVASSLTEAVAFIAPEDGATLILPSSLSADDALARAVAEQVAHRPGASAEVVIPSGWGGRLRRLRGDRSGHWQAVDVRSIDASAELERVVLPGKLVAATGILVACDLDRVATRGPYVLDVAASYVGPATRLRLHANRGRLGIVAEVDLAIRLRGALLALTIDGQRRYVATPDPIAGELAALALSERARGADRAVVGPWEDPIVQRATELGLGALLPAVLDLAVPEGEEPLANAIRDHLALRLGVTRS